MSERDVFDPLDDGEPPSVGETYSHNQPTAEFDDAAVREYYEQHLEIWDLCAAADLAIDIRLPERNFIEEDKLAVYGIELPDDAKVGEGSAVLRRIRHSYEKNGRVIGVSTYFLTDSATGYQRTWTNQDTRVHQRHDDEYSVLTECVKERLDELFPDPRAISKKTRQKFGLVARLLNK